MARYGQFLLQKRLFFTIIHTVFNFFFVYLLFSFFLLPFPPFTMILEIGYTSSSMLLFLLNCCPNFVQFLRRKEHHLGIASFYACFILLASSEHSFNTGTSWVNDSYSFHYISSLNISETHHAWSSLSAIWFHSVKEAAYALTQFRASHIHLLLRVAMHWIWLCIIILHLFWFMSGLHSERVTLFLTFPG